MDCEVICLKLNDLFFQDADEGLPDFANMTEEEQIAFAMQMSMQDHGKNISFRMQTVELYLN